MKIKELIEDARWHQNEPVCKHCDQRKGDHKAMTLACPIGKKSRMSQAYSKDSTFDPKQ
jgi:hypothetical protein